MDQNELPLPFLGLDYLDESVREMERIERIHLTEAGNGLRVVSEKMDGERPRMLMVGRDNLEILKVISENREELIAQGIDLDRIMQALDHADDRRDWPDPTPFLRLAEDMKEDYTRKMPTEHWTPGQGAPIKRGKKRR